MTARNIKTQKGFTLIELLVVIGILAILLSIVLIAINPARQFAQANNTRRQSDVTATLNAIGAFAADNKGVLPTGIPVAPAAAADTSVLCHELLGTADASNPTGASYISALPVDPSAGPTTGAITTCAAPVANSGYTVQQDTAGRVTVAAPSAEQGVTVSITR